MNRLVVLCTLLFAMLLPGRAAAAVFVVGPRIVSLDAAGKATFVLRSDALAPVRLDVARVEGVAGAPLQGTLTVTPRELTLPPRGSQKIEVKWDAPRDSQLFAHVVFRVEGKELVVPVQSGNERGEPLRFLVLAPIVLAVVAAWLARKPALAKIAGFVGVVSHGALLAWALARFSPSFDAERGNDGLQLVSRTPAPWGTWLCAVDGPGMLGLLAVLAVAAGAISGGVAVHGVLVLLAGASLVLTAWDTTSIVLGLSLVVGGVALSIGPKAVGRTLLPSAIGVVLVGTGLRSLVAAAPLHVRSLPELARVDWVSLEGAQSSTVLGLPLVQGAFVAVLLGLCLLAAAPLASGAGVVAVSVSRLVAGLLLVRILPYVLGASTQWAAPGLAWAGAVLLVLAAGATFAVRGDGARLAAALGAGQLGAMLLGLAACTAQGLAGAMIVAIGGSLGTAGLGLAVEAIERRLGPTDLRGLTGLVKDAPALAFGAIVALAAACLAPGTVGFHGGALSLGGAFPLHRAALVVAALGHGALGLVALRLAATVLGGEVERRLVESPRLEPFGGHIPELRRDEALALFCALAPVLALAFGEVALGFVEVASRQLLGDATRLGIG